MTEYYEEGGLLYEQSPPMHIKVESPEGPFGGGASENGFPREDDDSEGSCDQNSGLPGGLPFNVVVVHPNIMAPGMSSDDLLSIEQNRAMSAALAAGGAGKRKSRFSGAELEVLVSEVTRCEGELFGPAGRLRRRERERIWAGILERVNAVSRVPRTLREVKKRWDDLKRRNGGRLADARHRSCYLPSSRGASMLGRPSQTSPRLQQARQKLSTRPKPSFPCFPDSDTGVGVEGSERDGLEKDEDNPERDRDMGEPECEPVENSMEDKLGLGLGLGIGPPPPSERWLPPSPLYSAPFLNGSPQPSSPQPSLGAQQGPLEAPPRSSWLEDELRGLGEAAIQLGNRVEKSLREFGEGFRQDMRTLVASQEALAVSLQQNNVLLQRLLGVLEAQQQPQPQQHRVQQAHQSQTSQQHLQPQPAQQLQHIEPQQQQQQRIETPLQTQLQHQQQPHVVQQQSQQHQTQIQQQPLVTQHSNNQSAAAVVPAPSSPDVHGTFPSDPPIDTNGSVQRPRRGRDSDEKEPLGEVDGIEDVVENDEDADRVEDADSMAKPKKCRLVCKECGKTFNRRETFNLHRHFHAHEDELTPLTCKECGLTFQHRSSLIKHRNEHKEKEEQLVTPKKEMQTKEDGSFECAECERIFSTVDKLRDHNCCNTVEKPYHCPLCRQEFQFKVSVTKHMMTHSKESIFTCQECSQIFPNTMALRYHQRCHTALKPYECPECGMVFKHYSVMEDHRRKHTDNTRSHLCNICGKTFKYSSLLHQHQYLHTGQKPFRCPECGKKFAFAQNMKAHCRQHRLRETNSSAEQPSKQAPVTIQETGRGPGKENAHQTEEPKRTFNCPLCPQTYWAPANLRAHMLIHEAEYEKLERTPRPPSEINKYWEKGHTCPHCPCVYRDESSLNVHMLSVHKSVAQYLEKVAATPKKELTPLRSDNVQGKWRSDGISIKSYKCSECGKTFRHRSVLELHMRIHSKDKPYQCKVCGKGFRFSSYLQQHLIIHTGKKPYKCPDCGKDFAFLQNMKTHQKLHQEKPFRCTSCRKGYSDETQLQHHMLSHNGDKPHKCDLCDKSFGLAYLLRDHMNTHTGERPHRCDECHKTFSWFSSLLVHQKIHARKRQGFSQYNSFPMGARMRGRGSRGRRGGRLMWGWSRPLGGSGMVSSQPSPYPVSALRDAELHRRAVQPQSSTLSSRMDLQGRQQKEPWLAELHPQPVQWKVDGGEVMPVPSSQQQHALPLQTRYDSLPQPVLQQHHQRSPGWADSPSITQSGPTSAQSSESSHMKESAASIVSSLLAAVPKKSSPSVVSEMEQPRQPKPVTWSNTPTSTVLASTSSLQHDFSVPSYIDGAALWSVRPALPANSRGSPNKLGQELQLPRWPGSPVSTQKEPPTPPKKEDSRVWDMSNPQVIPSTVSQPEKPWNGCELQKQWASGLAGASTSAQIDQSSAMPVSTPVSHGVGSTLWDIQTPPGIPKTINYNSPDKLVNNQDFQKQVSSGWANVQSQTATQKVPISIQYEPHRFGQGLGTPVWGFQSNPVGPQTLLTGQLKPGNGQELQQQPMVTGTQIIINQPSPFFSPPLAPLPPLALPGPHPLHSVAVGALPRAPHPNIFFTPQAVMSERPHMPQTLPLPQLAPRTEPHKLGPRLPFAPERLLQCMICGCSLPRELDLQMHYLQHAQGEI